MSQGPRRNLFDDDPTLLGGFEDDDFPDRQRRRRRTSGHHLPANFPRRTTRVSPPREHHRPTQQTPEEQQRRAIKKEIRSRIERRKAHRKELRQIYARTDANNPSPNPPSPERDFLDDTDVVIGQGGRSFLGIFNQQGESRRYLTPELFRYLADELGGGAQQFLDEVGQDED